MAYKFNPFTGNLDEVGAGGGGGGTPGGADTQVQFNDGGAFGGDAGLSYNKTTDKLSVGGDLDLGTVGTFSTTLQTVTPTANRTVSIPDATGTIGLVNGPTGSIQFNQAGALNGTSDFSTTLNWNNAATTFTGLKLNVTDTASAADSKLLDLQVGGVSKVYANTSELAHIGTNNSINAVGSTFGAVYARKGTSVSSSSIRCFIGAGFGVGVVGNETAHPLNIRTNNTNRLVLDTVGSVQISTALTVATLPGTPAVGMIARITDGDSGLGFGATVVNSGAGATPYLCWYNGTNWTVIGA